MIVIKNNEKSEYYANYCIKSWESYGIKVNRFDAIVPKDLIDLTELKWNDYVNRINYEKQNLKVKMTDTEKSCFSSHYMLWKKCVEMDKPILILEHDCYLEIPENLWFNSKYGTIFYDKAASGSYVMFPWFAKVVVNFIKGIKIDRGLYALLYVIAYLTDNLEKHVCDSHPKYKAASNQVMSKVYGNTIEHFSDPVHDFKMI
jgi:hypothetical protein